MAIRTDVVRIYRQVHTWTGILTGLILFVCFYAGALTMFKEPLERWITPPVEVTPATLDRAEELVAATRALRPEVRDFTLAVEPALAGEAPLRLTWTEERFDPAPWAATVRVWGHDPRYLVRREGFVLMGAVDGRIIDTQYMPGHQNGWSATVSAFFALHFGTFGGGILRWCYFLLGLAGAALFYTGNLLWIESRRRTERQLTGQPLKGPQAGGPAEQSLATRLLAAGMVGVCLGCVGALSLTIASGKWLNGLVDDLHAWHWGIYYVAFLGACAWAFLRGAARAGVELLWACAAATAAIPATSLLGLILPGPWVSDGLIGVDLVALAGALAFAAMARRAERRVRSGPRDSVWRAPQSRVDSSLEPRPDAQPVAHPAE